MPPIGPRKGTKNQTTATQAQPAQKPRKARGKPTQATTANGEGMVYPYFRTVAHVLPHRRDPKRDPASYADPITAEQMKEMLGWTEEPSKGAFGGNYLLRDEAGVKVRCVKNLTNRKMDEARARALAQVILKRQYQCNGEAMIIGQYGNALSIQHRGIALILAEQIRTGPQAPTWERYWDGPCYIETVVSYGVEETGAVTRTLDNVKPRTLADVLFTDPTMFPTNNSQEREELVKMAAFAMKEFWTRCAFAENFRNKYRSHSESLEVFDRYPGLIKCVKHIWQENKNRVGLNEVITPGVAAAVMYMMAACHTDTDEFRNSVREGVDREELVDLSAWDKAEEFWALLVKNGPQLFAMRNALARTKDTVNGGSGGTRAERHGIIIKAWAAFLNKGKVTPGDVALEYIEEPGAEDGEPGRWHMIEQISCGGIDVVGVQEDDREAVLKANEEGWPTGTAPEAPSRPAEASESEEGEEAPYEEPEPPTEETNVSAFVRSRREALARVNASLNKLAGKGGGQ